MSFPKRTMILASGAVLLTVVAVYTTTQVNAKRARDEAEFGRKMEIASRALFQQNKWDDARELLQRWSDAQPNNAIAWRERGVAAASVGDYAQAETFLQKAVALNAKDGDAQLTLGGVHYARKEWAKSEAACRDALAISPQNVQAMFGLARALVAQNKSASEAETLARRTVESGDGGAVAYFTLAESLLAQRKAQAARSAVVRGLSLDAASAGGHDLLARVQTELGDAAGAKKTATLAAEIRQYTPRSPRVPDPIRVAQGESLLRTARYEPALARFLPVIKRDATNAGALEGAGLALLGLNDKTTASVYLEQAVRRDGERVRARVALGLSAYEQGLYTAAATHLGIVTEIQPANALAWHALGQTFAARKLHDAESEAALRRAVALEPRNIAYLMDYADALNTNNQPLVAQKMYGIAQRIAPDDPEVCGRFGAFLAQLPLDAATTTSEAETLLKKSLQTAPGDPFSQYHLGRLYVQQQRYKEAIPLLEGATRNGEGRTKDVWAALARAYQYQGRRDKAVSALAEAEKIQKRGDRYDKAVERLGSNLNSAPARLEMARASVLRGDNARALAEYAAYLRRVPKDSAVLKERATLVTSLKSSGKYPDMTLYNLVGASATLAGAK